MHQKWKKAKLITKKKTRFGNNQIPANFPRFSTPLELSLGQTYGQQLRHYKSIPSTLISGNFQGPANHATGFKGKGSKPHNFKYTQGLLGRSSLPSYLNINNPAYLKTYPHKFGRYFR